MISKGLKELPPHARRILQLNPIREPLGGTTSACAENTTTAKHGAPSNGNYLRVRGEYQSCAGGLDLAPGTTSACAENTQLVHCSSKESRNYLRVRGEYHTDRNPAGETLELPPRARRIHHRNQECCLLGGTTSACAENTPRGRTRRPNGGNYLRVRGEYTPATRTPRHSQELPPRARRIRNHDLVLESCLGTTSACAENTTLVIIINMKVRNYLRVRGEYKRPALTHD
mgnify:CR=1 FL=1